MVTRSGTNQLRGSVFWANHNSALDANNWFSNLNGAGKDYDKRNQFGARVGGPIIKNKTFFFALFEGQRDIKRQSALGTTLTPFGADLVRQYRDMEAKALSVFAKPLASIEKHLVPTEKPNPKPAKKSSQSARA